jgi:hypothetical protein
VEDGVIEAERPPPTVIAGVLGAAAVVGFVAGGVFGSLSFGTAADASPPDGSDRPTATAPVALTVTAASCQRETRRDAAGNEVDYRADYAVDGDTNTGWQCQGDGAGETLELELGGPAKVTMVGLIPGYTKVDPHDGREWYPLFRRLTEVRWHFDSGDPVSQQLDPDPEVREVQTIELPEPRETSSVRLEIVSSTRGDTADRSVVAVSEIEVLAAQ